MFLIAFLLVNIINNPRKKITTLNRLLELIGVTLNPNNDEVITMENENNDNKDKGIMNGDFILIFLSI
tara:strand:+ start:1624 stop:1827 length:204 start_codon:yes stop_codon:yes gene_type:complete